MRLNSIRTEKITQKLVEGVIGARTFESLTLNDNVYAGYDEDPSEEIAKRKSLSSE